MKKILTWLIWVPVGIVLALFLVANRQPVAISLDPVSVANPAIATPALPLWFWLSLMMFFGFGLGAVGMWISARPARHQARADRRELKALKTELAARAARDEGETVPALKAV